MTQWARRLVSAWLAVWRFTNQLAERVVVGMIRLYQRGVSPLLGNNCRFRPTCSEYMIGAVKKYGLIRGGWKGAWRILRCHPFCRGGYDPP
jgi:uncharacterized protein